MGQIYSDEVGQYYCGANISRYGTATIKRAYGDWTTPNLRGWKEVLLSHAIEPRQQFSYTTGKNATDSALIIDAMDLLHTKSLGGFCIVSSDSDYTRLATRIREAGAFVYGFGERKTPQPFVAACDKFVYTEVLRSSSATPSASQDQELALEPLLRASIAAAARDSGWSALGVVGSLLSKKDPSFDPRNFGFQKLGELVRAQRYVEVKETPIGDGSTNVHLYVRLRAA
ncbi:MAG: NYN domain-containing protein [Burkholderiaceae bacterium]|nr:NYN domain-containing protein [Burkholderiaceae bacterium]